MNISTKFVTDNRKSEVLQSKRLLQLSAEKGVFNWLTMLPIASMILNCQNNNFGILSV